MDHSRRGRAVTFVPHEKKTSLIKRSAKKMKQEYPNVADLIREAFSGVTFGNGVGLWQGQALDDCADAATIAEHRTRDEKDDWTLLTIEDLNRCHSSLCFFDAEGMRFHIPAFLLAELEGTLSNGVMFNLTELSDYHRSQFSALNSAQRTAIRQFLLIFRDDPEFEFERPSIERALTEYWIEEAQQEIA